MKRGARQGFAGGGLLVLGCVGAAAAAAAGTPSGIAVAPFAIVAGRRVEPRPSGTPDVASLLAGALSRQSTARIVGPDGLRGDESEAAQPSASAVRRWARWNDVDKLVVGETEKRSSGGYDVRVELRSGHSGAPSAEYRLEPASASALPGAVDELAVLILADAGEPVKLPPVAAPAASGGASDPGTAGPAREADGASVDPGEGGLALLPEAQRDEPISIESDELEVLPEKGGRKLIFSRQVRVAKGDIRLRADRLEATYPQGASQPDRLRATGNVSVSQGERRARCEEAIYERASQMIHCRGRAEVDQGCDRVRGDEISFDLAHERVRVQGAASVVIQPADAESGHCEEDAP